MEDKIIIGNGNYGCTAIVCFRVKGQNSISENGVSFWIHHLIFDSVLIIFKDTKEGIKLEKMINENELPEIMKYLNKLVLKRISLEWVEIAIENIQDKSYSEGRRDMQEEFRTLLGLRN